MFHEDVFPFNDNTHGLQSPSCEPINTILPSSRLNDYYCFTLNHTSSIPYPISNYLSLDELSSSYDVYINSISSTTETFKLQTVKNSK